MSSMPMSPAMSALMTVAMMVAMMLPSFAPSLWRYHRHLRAMRIPRSVHRAALFTAGYLSVWTAIGLALSALPSSRVTPWVAGVVVLCAGALQRSPWKAKQLLRCAAACVAPRAPWENVTTALRDGGRLGVDCALSCTAPMAVLVVAGRADSWMMVVITVAIVAERVAPVGARIARLTGSIALIAGLVICLRAIEGRVAPMGLVQDVLNKESVR